ncbi:MAG: hypothetical protein L3J08_03020 [Flavobacteriaceae bacterium]|nr:hypothetical protein [Flavobacteriaceae bacterium]
MKKLYLLFIFIYSFQLYAQEERIIIVGEIKNDSLSIDNVHIINLTSKTGTLSNKFGVFEIAVQVNDTILFSNIQFENKIILIQKHHLENKRLRVNFLEDINELDEIIVTIPNDMAKSLGLPNAGKIPLTHTERKVNYYKKAGNITKLYGLISGDTKRRKKIQRLEEEDKKSKVNQKEILKIRHYFKDEFFIGTLKIEKDDINNFITSCVSKGIIPLYQKGRYLEIVDIFLSKNKSLKE